jgi:hypothetical protein
MTNKELKYGNELITDFLEWDLAYIDEATNSKVINIPNNFYEDTGTTEWFMESFLFDTSWEWTMFLWNELHRKVCIPMMRDNRHLRYLRTTIQETKKAIVWCHIEDAYKNMVKLIEIYNEQFEQL